jgi:UDP-N-acetyl-D-glucosamine dehydrogenase
VRGAKILVLGVAYKAGVADTRESPALRLITLLTERQACVRFHDPFVPEVTTAASLILKSVALDQAALADADAVLIATDHPGIDYAWVVEHAALVIDTRHATASVTQGRDKIVDA